MRKYWSTKFYAVPHNDKNLLRTLKHWKSTCRVVLSQLCMTWESKIFKDHLPEISRMLKSVKLIWMMWHPHLSHIPLLHLNYNKQSQKSEFTFCKMLQSEATASWWDFQQNVEVQVRHTRLQGWKGGITVLERRNYRSGKEELQFWACLHHVTRSCRHLLNQGCKRKV